MEDLSKPRHHLLTEYRTVDGSDNNLVDDNLNPTTGSDEVRLTEPNYAPGTTNGLIDGPNPRTISTPGPMRTRLPAMRSIASRVGSMDRKSMAPTPLPPIACGWLTVT